MPKRIPTYVHPPQRTAELDRIEALPRRRWTEAELEVMVELVWRRLAKSSKAPRPWTGQAQALIELSVMGGVVCPMDTGEGKTLIGLLAASVVDCEAPIYLVPSELREKAKRDLREAQELWHVHPRLRIAGYGELSAPSGKNLLEGHDMLILEEAHNVSRPTSTRGGRVAKYICKALPKVVALSGSMIDRSIAEAALPMAWCLAWHSPMPLRQTEVDSWAAALDPVDPKAPKPTTSPGILGELAKQSNTTPRCWFQQRLESTPGVVVRRSSGIGASLYISASRLPVPDDVRDMIKRLGQDGKDPDGLLVETDTDVARMRWMLARGWWQRWDPAPPDWWLQARSAWQSIAKQEIESGIADSMGELTLYAQLGKLPKYVVDALEKWREVDGMYQRTVKVTWVHDELIKWARALLDADRECIAWVHHQALGRKLAEVTGYPYFESGSQPIEQAEGPIIASMRAQSEGKNLQHKWSSNLILEPPASAKRWQQLIARTHRKGQRQSVVHVDIACPEDGGHQGSSSLGRLATAREWAKLAQETGGGIQKILLADYAFNLSPRSAAEVDRWWSD